MRILFLGLALMLAMPSMVFGATFRAGDNPSVPAGQTIQDDLYMAGGTLSTNGTVAGDLYAGGGTLVIGGAIGQDLVAGGGTISLTGAVSDDVRLAGGSLVLQSRIGGDVVAGGGSITITGPGVGGDVVAGGGMVSVEAPVGGDVRAGGGKIYINSSISGNVVLDADAVELGPAAVIGGDLTYRSPKEMTRADGARITGAINYEPREARTFDTGALAAFITLALVARTLMVLALALVIGLVFRRFAKEAVESAVASPWLELGRGAVATIVLPVLAIILVITIIGIPFGIIALLSFIILCLVSAALSAIFLGVLLFKWISRSDSYAVTWQSILLGVVAYLVLQLIPIIGWVILLLFWLAAFGATVGIIGRIAREWR